MGEPTFATDIRSLFREKDRSSMLSRFDLWSLDDVRENASAILAVLQAGKMPCDGPWRSADIELFGRWIDSGMSG
jgi:hypothetical protein